MHLNPSVFDVWVFRRTARGVEYLLLHTSQQKADRYFNGGRFWQIPSGVIGESEDVTSAIDRELELYGVSASSIWTAEHCYVIYNRRFEELQIISVYAAETASESIRLRPEEHSAYEWLDFDEALRRVNYRGLKDGLRSTREYVSGIRSPARELCLR
jgi:hypothetical protein